MADRSEACPDRLHPVRLPSPDSITWILLAIAIVLSFSGAAMAFEEGDPIEVPTEWDCTTPSGQTFTVSQAVAERINAAGGKVSCEPIGFDRPGLETA